jgi:hypothetical protein
MIEMDSHETEEKILKAYAHFGLDRQFNTNPESVEIKLLKINSLKKRAVSWNVNNDKIMAEAKDFDLNSAANLIIGTMVLFKIREAPTFLMRNSFILYFLFIAHLLFGLLFFTFSSFLFGYVGVIIVGFIAISSLPLIWNLIRNINFKLRQYITKILNESGFMNLKEIENLFSTVELKTYNAKNRYWLLVGVEGIYIIFTLLFSFL